MADGEEKPKTKVRKSESVQTPERKYLYQRALLSNRPFTLASLPVAAVIIGLVVELCHQRLFCGQQWSSTQVWNVIFGQCVAVLRESDAAKTAGSLKEARVSVDGLARVLEHLAV